MLVQIDGIKLHLKYMMQLKRADVWMIIWCLYMTFCIRKEGYFYDYICAFHMPRQCL